MPGGGSCSLSTPPLLISLLDSKSRFFTPHTANMLGTLCTLITALSYPSLPAASLTLFPPSPAELQADRVSVVCVAEDVPTGLAELSWLLAGNPLSSGISTASPQRQPNSKFRLSSILTIQTAHWTSDKDLSCQVTSAGSTASKSIRQSDCSR
ncbi:hypothetical protein ACEWY4_002661 [Coilia grayii]|uniref:Ig-like domain-containing protein n=1 Tax=Coilia grayii TaxID=363190 RepID=A0ABD1KNY9_9TELE